MFASQGQAMCDSSWLQRDVLVFFLLCSCCLCHRRRHVQLPHSSDQAVPSAGCSGGGTLTTNVLLTRSMTSEDRGLPAVTRNYRVYLPSSYSQSSPSPLVMIFHGWGEGASSYHYAYKFGKLAQESNFIAVYPVGVADCQAGADCGGYASWNAMGSAHSNQSLMSCDPYRQNWNYCYDSCATLKGNCHRCDWTSCYDDVAFVGDILDSLEAELCVDLRRRHALGCSNGGLMAFELTKSLPGQFASIGAVCGARPHAGWEGELLDGPPVSVLLIGGTRDRVMPQHGPPGSGPPSDKAWWDGYRYADVSAVTAVYSERNSCMGTVSRPFPVSVYSAKGMDCIEDGYDCQGNASVVRCTFSGGHSFNDGLGEDSLYDGPQLLWSFFQTHPLQRVDTITSASTSMMTPARTSTFSTSVSSTSTTSMSMTPASTSTSNTSALSTLTTSTSMPRTSTNSTIATGLNYSVATLPDTAGDINGTSISRATSMARFTSMALAVVSNSFLEL